MLFKYLDDLPQLPNELIKEVYKSMTVNEFQFPEYRYYKIYDASEDLKIFLNSIFPEFYKTKVQVIYNNIAIHKDYGRTVAYNYIITTGGNDAETVFYKENLEIYKKFKIEKCRWHRLDVTQYHSVQNLNSERIAITVFPPV